MTETATTSSNKNNKTEPLSWSRVLKILVLVAISSQLLRTPQFVPEVSQLQPFESSTHTAEETRLLENGGSSLNSDTVIAEKVAEKIVEKNNTIIVEKIVERIVEKNNTVIVEKIVEKLVPPPGFQNQHAVCQYLAKNASSSSSSSSSSSVIPTAGNVWIQNLELILEASRHPLDFHFEARDFVHNLLLDLPPTLLQKGLKSRPKPEEVTRILQIIQNRRQNPETAPPLKILVMGGSVTEGVGCKQGNNITGRTCNWSTRLEGFLNTILGFDAVQVTNMANGGTNTEQALQLVRYWLYPDQILPEGPDIIIHAFGSNDSHLGKTPDWEYTRILELMQQGVGRLNWFVKEVHSSSNCPPPIIFHLDDYVGGHAQGNILGDMTYNMAMGQVATWYQNLAVSSADVVRELIYSQTKAETIFSPKWKLKSKKKKYRVYSENCHFGWGGHQMIVWAWAYSFLDVIVNYCEQEDWKIQLHGKEKELGEKRKTELTKQAQYLRSKGVVPPPLDAGLRLEDVSRLWKEEDVQQENYCSNVTSTSQPCIFAWVSGQEGQTKSPTKLMEYLIPITSTKDGWTAENDESHGWARKLGLVATKANAKLEHQLKNITQLAKTLTIHSIKSYGEKWEGSRAQILVTVKPPPGAPEQAYFQTVLDGYIDGVHKSTSSIAYTTKFDLEPAAEEGSDVVLSIKLVGGSTFKITGMMLCSR